MHRKLTTFLCKLHDHPSFSSIVTIDTDDDDSGQTDDIIVAMELQRTAKKIDVIN